MKPIEVENVGVMNIFVKSFLGQQKIGKTPFSAKNAIFANFCILHFFKFFYHEKVETLRFSNMYDTYRRPSSMMMLNFKEGMKKSKNCKC